VRQVWFIAKNHRLAQVSLNRF